MFGPEVKYQELPSSELELKNPLWMRRELRPVALDRLVPTFGGFINIEHRILMWRVDGMTVAAVVLSSFVSETPA